MSKYVMSDLHGCYEKFIKMLELIDFKDTDELYIIGDVFDRGNKPLEIIDYIINHKNITLLKGNHEQMYLDFYEDNDASLWYHNGGETTHTQIINRDYTYELSLYSYLKKLPYIKIVDKFILVHAGLYLTKDYNNLTLDAILKMQDEETCLWNRDNIGHERKIDGYTIIVGHTPVQTITNNYKDVKILHRNGTIYIDCGCVFERANGKLACLRIDNMEEFYV